MSTLNVGNITDGTNSVATEKLSKGTAAAWVNFDGTGTVSIRGSYNVSSITDNGTGKFAINFSTPLSSADYCVSGTTGPGAGASVIAFDGGSANYVAPTTDSFIIRCCADSGNEYDRSNVMVVVFSN